MKRIILTLGIILVTGYGLSAQTVTGTVTEQGTGEPIPGVNIIVEGTSTGTSTDLDGTYQLDVPSLDETLVFTFVGFQTQRISINDRTEINVEMVEEVYASDEVVVVGYGTQEKSDVTGSVSSITGEDFERAPNQNIGQAIQGALPGVRVQTTSTGAAPEQSILVRGRNSIAADNSPLIVLDGVPFNGNLGDINPNDVGSIEILKDASAAAIYGSRGSNGVILVTTKQGVEGPPRISYEGKITTRRGINFPDLMNGEQFWEFKNERDPSTITQTERQMYEAGRSTDWVDLSLRNGIHNEHNLSVSGKLESLTYYVSGNFMDVQGLVLNDDYQRITGRVNLDIDINEWLTLGTRTSATDSDQSGVGVDIKWGGQAADGVLFRNPLTPAFDENGNIITTPWPEDGRFGNPLSPTTHPNVDDKFQIISNNYLDIELPFIEGLSNRINVGIRKVNSDYKEYIPRTTWFGDGAHQGFAELEQGNVEDITLENILNFERDFNQHSLDLTGVVSYEKNQINREITDAQVFPNDLLAWNALSQAGVVETNFDDMKTVILSQMLRINYGYDSRYLITVTARRDGYSGFGEENKWGIFPSMSLAWNFANEEFFPWEDLFNQLKPRVSFGINGNQAVNPYGTIASFRERNTVSMSESLGGYLPNTLGNESLGWESSQTINVGVDFGLFDDRVAGAIDFYNTKTSDLLLQRNISTVHGFSSILQNIGETKNQGVDIELQTRNFVEGDFSWSTRANVSFNKNEILELYGDGRDDPVNNWFIGEPIRVNYDYVFDGVWQEDEAAEAQQWGVNPGNVKIKDLNGDGAITGADRQILGQNDPDFRWGLSNSFNYKSFNLNVSVYGAHGATKLNQFRHDDVWETVSRNLIVMDWWTPDNPTNEMWANRFGASQMEGVDMGQRIYEDASFVRIRDVTLGYELPPSLLDRIGISRMQVYVTGRNMHTFTSYGGLDPELDVQAQGPLPMEYTMGVNIDF